MFKIRKENYGYYKFSDITILLAMVVFMDQLSQQTPPMPSSLPVIGQFFVASMIIIAVSMFSTIFCLKLHHTQGREARQMPKWVMLRSHFL